MKKIKLFWGDRALAALGIVLLLGIIAQQVTGRVARAEVSSLEKEVAGVQRELAAAGGLADVEALKKTVEEERRKAVAFPTEQEALGTVNAIWAWAGGAGVTLDHVSYSLGGDVVEGWRYPAHLFNVSGEGKPLQVARFLESMEKSGMKTLSVGSSGLSLAGGEEWRFSLVVKVWSAGIPAPK